MIFQGRHSENIYIYVFWHLCSYKSSAPLWMQIFSESGQDLLLWFDASATSPTYNKLQLHYQGQHFQDILKLLALNMAWCICVSSYYN